MISTQMAVEMALGDIAEHGTASLLHFDGTNGSQVITDSYGITWTANNSAQLATAEKKFGTASLLLDPGTSDYVSAVSSDVNPFWMGDFTIDMWVYPTTDEVLRICGQGASATSDRSILMYETSDNRLGARIHDTDGTAYTALATSDTTYLISQGAWNHIAMVRAGDTLYNFLNGTLTATVAVAGVHVQVRSDPFSIGALGDDGTTRFKGQVDEFRISRTARWTASFTPPVAAYVETAWTDISADVRAAGATFSWGITAIGPTERQAGTGSATLTLDNSQANSAGTLGYYSPDSSDVRSGFAIGTPFRVKVLDTPTSDTSDNVTHYKKFYITDITPEPGKNLGRGVGIGGADYINKMSSQYADALEVETTSRVDEGLYKLYQIMPVMPDAIESSTGVDVLDYIFTDVDGKKTTIFNAGQRLVQTDLGYHFCSGDGTFGETMAYQTRHDRLSTTSCVTLNDTMSGLTVQHADKNIYNQVTAISYPVNLGSSETSDAEVLYDLPREITLAAGTTESFTFRYRDPSAQSNTIRLYPDSGVTPTTDTYKVSSISGDGGSDLTTDVSVTVTWYADHADVVFVNGASQTGYLNMFEVRGRAIRLYDPAEAVASGETSDLITYGKRPLRFALPYLDNPNTAKDFADFLLSKWGLPNTQVESVEFYPNRDQTLYSAAVGCDIGDKITVTETVTGISEDYNINGIEWTFEKTLWKCKWYLEKATGGEYWFLGVTGLSELGVTTFLGF